MTLRFLRVTASAIPTMSFQPGHEIHVVKLTSEMREWIKDGNAELVPAVSTEPELAAVTVPERAVRRRSRQGA